MTRFLTLAAAALLVGGTLAGCSEDEPPVCTSVDNLQSSVNDVKSIDVSSESALSDLESGLATVQTNLADVKSDAQAEFSSGVETVETSFADVQSSIADAKSDPTQTTLAAAGAALSQFGSDVDTLISDIQTTC